MDRRAWKATVHWVTKSRTQLSDFHTIHRFDTIRENNSGIDNIAMQTVYMYICIIIYVLYVFYIIYLYVHWILYIYYIIILYYIIL